MSGRKIRLLDEITINQIAAGEVIENAASVVKELVENSLDAKASQITVETKPNLIRVIDDGVGIDEEDIPFAFERHATSKIASIHDLDLLKSLGFRGEALASIASVSKLSLITCSNNLGKGHFWEVCAGKPQKNGIFPRQKGTTIEVRSLFYNVPVRKKFLKSDKAENAAVLKALTHSVLCNPAVGFRWIHQDKVQFEFEKEDFLLERIKVLLGEEVSASLFPVEQEENDILLQGYSSKPSLHRPNRSGQFLFINGRPVASPFVSSKILEGYATRLPSHRFPIFILNLKVPSEWIDVNVHPQKKEVRFRNAEKLGLFLIKGVEKSLQYKEKPLALSVHFPTLAVQNDNFFQIEEENSDQKIPKESKNFESSLFASQIQILGKLGPYLLIEREGFFLVVDLKRARSRIAFEKLKKKTSLAVQHLLLPLTLEFSEMEKLKLIDNLETLNEMGIGIRFFGNKTFIVDSIPDYVTEGEIQELLLAFLAGEKTHKEKEMASAIHKTHFSLEEAKVIVEMLFQCEVCEETADGKRTFLFLTEKELEKRFNE